ncbi:group I intron-associated PD-(D/E)XK endonuclease [Streptomyces misionensis]|uniref:group I intron-associated PD-(D/E)XK endonuclease n=1 Tax=Streptomyces misionensis TaxID=67331 RepID=UPI00396BDE21
MKSPVPYFGDPEQLALEVKTRRTLHGPSAHESVSDLAAGTAAEHLVCADLLLAGYLAFLADQNFAYDIAVDLGGQLIRLQVKSTRGLRRIPHQGILRDPVYAFTVRRAKGSKRAYEVGEFDILALVALDIRATAYFAPSQHRQTIHIKPPGVAGGKQFSDFPFDAAVREVRAA